MLALMDNKVEVAQQYEAPSSKTMAPPEGSDPVPVKTSRKKLFFLGISSLVLFVVLSVGLGAGLDLGLRHNGKSVPSSTSPSAPAPSSELPSWRRDPSEYILDMDSWDINEPPTTRNFDFTVSKIEGYPDGELLGKRGFIASRH